MDPFVEAVTSQYEKCFKMLSETISRYDEQLWLDGTAYDSPAWQVAYHALYYANIYCSPSEERILAWPKARKKFYRFAGTPSAPSREDITSTPYSKEDMLELLGFVRNNIPAYLREMRPHEKCWPSWYNEPQFEFQLTNIRHIQHHIAQLIERHNNAKSFDYQWY
jgi:hypothetical protein